MNDPRIVIEAVPQATAWDAVPAADRAAVATVLRSHARTLRIATSTEGVIKGAARLFGKAPPRLSSKNEVDRRERIAEACEAAAVKLESES